MRRIVVFVIAVLVASGAGVGTADAAAPVHGRLSRSVGPLSPVALTITGHGLKVVKKVRFGTVVVRRLAHHGSTKLTLKTPRMRSARTSIVGLWNGRKWVTAGRYHFLAKPVITGLSRTSGQPIGGESLVLYGHALTPSPRVSFGGAVLPIRYASSTRLTVKVPPGLEGAVHVAVSTPGGVSASRTYTYAVPGSVASATYATRAGTATANPNDVQWVDGGPDPDDLSSTAYRSWTVSLAPGATVPSVGDGYYLAPGADVFPSGLTGRVASIAAQADGSVRLTIDPAPIDDTLGAAAVSFSGDHTTSPQLRRPQSTSVEVDQDFAGRASYSDLTSRAFTCDNGLGQDVSFSGSLNITFTRLHPVAYFDALHGPSFDVYLAGTVVVTGKITAEEALDCTLTPLWVDAHRRIIPIGTTGATLSFGPAAELKISVAGTVEVEQTTRFMYGVTKYESDAPQFIHVAATADRSVSVNAELSVTASAGVSIQFGLLDRVGIQAQAQLYASGTASAPVTGPSRLCVSVDWGFSISLDAFLDLFVARWDSAARTFKISFGGSQHCGPPVGPASGSGDPEIVSTVLPDATLGTAYDEQLETSDGRDGSWAIVGGALPAGLTLDPSGEITGTPTNGVGTRHFTVRFTDAGSRSVSDDLELAVDPGDGLGGGDMQATLTWNGTADLDLHAQEPSGNEIYYGNAGPSADGGDLDHDSNAGCNFVDPAPAENIHWPAGEAESGVYYVWVQTYATCDSTDLNWHLVVRVQGRVVLDTTGSDTSTEYEIDYGTGANAAAVVRRVPQASVHHPAHAGK